MTSEAMIPEGLNIVQAHSRPKRVAFLDGLRGLAAVQVVLLHYCAAFLPGLGTQNVAFIHYGWENAWLHAPLFFVLNGTFAVYVFFAISGMVLTLAFGRPTFSPARAVGQRVVRLGLPMAAALAFGMVLLRLIPDAHHEAASISGSTGWLGALYQAPYTFSEVAHQVVTSGMLSGYNGSIVLPQIADALLDRDPITRSLDPPLWTLHYEFWGSILIVLLAVGYRRLPTRIHFRIAGILALALSRYPLLPFVVGHLFALAWREGGWPMIPSARWRTVGVVALVAAVWSCTNPAWPWVTRFFQASDRLSALNDTHLQAMYGALLAFTGVLLVPALHRLLASRMSAWLGRISFGLYLTHFPILFTVASAIFVASRGPLHYGGAALLAFMVGMPLSLLAAEVFTRLVDQPAMRLSRMLSNGYRMLRTSGSVP